MIEILCDAIEKHIKDMNALKNRPSSLQTSQERVKAVHRLEDALSVFKASQPDVEADMCQCKWELRCETCGKYIKKTKD